MSNATFDWNSLIKGKNKQGAKLLVVNFTFFIRVL